MAKEEQDLLKHNGKDNNNKQQNQREIGHHQPDDQEVDLENEYDGDFWIKVGLIKELLNIAKPLISWNLRENRSYCQVQYLYIRLMFKLGRRFFAI